MPRKTEQNRQAGAAFEAVFVHRARCGGLLPIKQHLTFRYIGNGTRQPQKSELDFSLISRRGEIAYIDCKTVSAKYFVKSRLDKAQVQRAAVYNAWRVPAGFVIYWVGYNVVSFISGAEVAKAAADVRFTPSHGILLGHYPHFELRGIFAKKD